LQKEYEFFEHQFDLPSLYQLFFFVLITVLIIPLFRKRDLNAIWNLAGFFYILFIVINSLFMWTADAVWVYFFDSLGYSVIYMLLAGIIVFFLINTMKIKGSGRSCNDFYVLYLPPYFTVVDGIR